MIKTASGKTQWHKTDVGSWLHQWYWRKVGTPKAKLKKDFDNHMISPDEYALQLTQWVAMHSDWKKINTASRKGEITLDEANRQLELLIPGSTKRRMDAASIEQEVKDDIQKIKENYGRTPKKKEKEWEPTDDDWTAWRIQCGNLCCYCGNDIGPGSQYKATMDHIIPRANHGKHCFENIELVCQSDNSKKGTKSKVDYMSTIPHAIRDRVYVKIQKHRRILKRVMVWLMKD